MADRGRPRSFDREAALREAMLVFWSKGFEGTSMVELTDAMGIRSASLYAAFGSKEALFREAVAFYQERLGPMIWAPLDAAEATIDEAITGLLMRTAEAFCNAEYPAGCLIMLGAHHAGEGTSTVGDELRRRRANDVTRLRQRFDRAVHAGELPPGFDSNGAASFYSALQAGMSILARDGAGPAMMQAIAAGGVQSLAGMKRQVAATSK